MNLLNILEGYKPFKSIEDNLSDAPISVSGTAKTAQPQIMCAIKCRGPRLVITYSDMESRELLKDLKLYTDNAVMFPSKDYTFYNIESVGRAKENARLLVLDKILTDSDTVVVASVESLLTYTAERERFISSVIEITNGCQVNISEITKSLTQMGYKREDMIEGVGQFSLRGGILDVFPPNCENPVRIELWGDEVDSVREFEVESQRAVGNIDGVRIIPATEALYSDKRRDEIILELERRLDSAKKSKKAKDEYILSLAMDIELFRENFLFPSVDKYISLIYGKIPTLLDYFDKNSLVFVPDPKRICEGIRTTLWEKTQTVRDLQESGILGEGKCEYYKTEAEVTDALSGFRLVALEVLSHTKNSFTYRHLESFTSKTTVSFHGKLEYLFEDLLRWQKDGYTVVVAARTRGRCENLCGVFNDRGIKARICDDGEFNKGETVIIRGEGSGGYEYPDIKFVLVCEEEIFRSNKSRQQRRRDNANRIKAYNDISVGDYVVHAAHGIGEYVGLQKMTVDGVSKDYLKVQYRGSDVLYVPVDQLDLLYKYGGKGEDKTVKLNRLGTQEWTRQKGRVKESTDKLAKELIALYRERGEVVGHPFSEDTPWQREFEDTFAFNETADQLRSVEEVKADMEKPVPMDRLLCGDVGFGKTEIALRAAFKAVCDSKQVAYLCPTTILAMQHYETFVSRMANFPVTVEMLSRFRTAKEQKEIIKKIKDGRVDIVIGTHRLLSEDISFKDLGLLIVDEEQRFGVAHKERIKALKSNVDVLTMTATPIPRTLHMAMTSVRDMSVLAEPPQNRYPVQTYALEFNEAIILDAIKKELSRGGQVFYLYNRVQGIYHKAQWLKEKFPDVEVAVGHGKMNETELEDIMYDMVNGTTRILVCTTIIETGLDIPNANTIIIENADRMGLAQLYQLRGRVGRSNRSAYAYLTYQRDKILSPEAQKRLSAIREFTEFGSGFKIAMRDLEIRGAGNMLGSEQHGHMDNVGYDMYCKILSESVAEAKGIKVSGKDSVTVDITVNAYIPENYIPSANQRVDMYKRIAAIESEDDEFEIQDELCDRFGDMPKSVTNLIAVAGLKPLAADIGCLEITEKKRTVILKFTDGILCAEIVFGLEDAFRGRVKVLSGDVPALRVTMKESDGTPLEFVKKLLTLIKELQNAKK